MTETAIKGIHHVTLSVSDLDRTVEWYVRVLGFEEFRRLNHGGLDKAMLRRDGVLVTFVCHGTWRTRGRSTRGTQASTTSASP